MAAAGLRNWLFIPQARKGAMSLIKVSAKARASAVAGVIVRVIRDHQRAELLAVGEEAINRALKAVDLATIYFRQN